ncbi:protein virilizer [Galleria mellonella]|uniref:Protein virilizer n=1 Tax=Galleria mellonella TaxID=7137 RepID=A0ABM3N5U1_GALME|nr:protein virilizer [Galleria mellonella]
MRLNSINYNMAALEQPDLLFFDTFSHDTSEELNLDLVQFPKSVFVREIRIIPLGARVEGDFPGGVRLGATNPTKFHIDFFVNDLSKPGASTFEALGSIDYCQNGQIHMECGNGHDQPRIPTDGLVLRGWYTTITLAVYGTLTQIIPESPVGSNPPPNIQRPSIAREVAPVQTTNIPQQGDWNQEGSNPIPSYTGNVASSNPDSYGPNNYPPDNYDNQMYRNEYYDNEPPKDPRSYHHMDDNEWEKDRGDISCERDGDRLRHSPRSIDHDRDRDRRDGRSRRRSLDRGRSRESSRHRDRSRELDRMERLHSRSRSRDRDFVVKGEYRPLSRSRSRSIDRDRMRGVSADRDWDRGPYKKDEYRRHRDISYDRSRGGSYEKDSGSYERRSPYDKRAPSYERKMAYEKRGPSYEKRLSPYDKRGSSYERRAPSYEKQTSYDRKRHSSPYGRMRGSSYGSRSPSRDDIRKKPRTPPGEISRRPLSPREGDVSSPINSIRSEDGGEYDRSSKQIPRVEFYHQNYRHKSSIRSPSQEVENPPYVEQQHSSLVTVPIVDNASVPKIIESPIRNLDEDRSMDAEQFEPILSDEDICDDSEVPYIEEEMYDVNDYCGADDIIKYYNPFKDDWNRYEYINKIQLLAVKKNEDSKDVLNATFSDLCDASPDLFKIWDITKTAKKREQKFFSNTFTEIDNASREEWVHQCEKLFLPLTNLCKNTDIILRIFQNSNKDDNEFVDVYNLLLTFCKIGLNFDFALAQQQPTYKIRHMKCGIRLAEALMSHKHNDQVIKILLNMGIDMPMLLLDIYSKEYMALSIRLMILKALNACLSSKESVEHFMQKAVFPKFDKNESDNDRKPKNGYQALISIMQTNPSARIKFSISALIKKLNMYELLGKLHDLVLNFNKKAAENNQNEDAELTENDTEFIINALEEILYMYRTQCFHISQPKRFLPASAQFDINKECSNEILLEFFNIHHILEVCLYLLTCPTTCNNLVVISPIHDLIYELVNSHNGLNFLYENMKMSELLFKTLAQPYGQQNADEFIYPHDLSNYSDLQILGLEMAYRLKALYYLQSICDLQAGKTDENELIDRLQSLYCLSFGSIGKTAVPDVIVMEDNAECLMEVFENDMKAKNKNESQLKQKSPAKAYAIELIVSVVRFSANVPFLKKYGQRLLCVSKEHDRFEPSVSSVLQEVVPYLKPIEKLSLLSGDDMAECVEILKTSLEHTPDLPGELMTCLRILRHFSISDYDNNLTVNCESATEEYIELKYKYNVLQLFSLDGVAHLAAILDRLAVHFEQPNMHTSFFASAKGLQLAQIMLPCLRLLDEMLARVVRCRGPRFRDLTAAPILLKSYGIAKAYPVGSVGYRTAAKAAEAAVRALLAYAQPIADDANDGDSIRRGPWTSLCSEVISYTMTAPYTFVPGLLVFSELLPLPLPMQSKTPPTERELADASNERRLWSAHLHALGNDLTDMIQIICMSTYRPVVHMLRRVCVQIADLAPNTAAIVAKAAVGAVTRELKPGEPATASCARVLGFLACLVSHAPVKCAVLHTMNNGGPRSADVQTALCGVLSLVNACNEHAAAQEFAAHALAAFCDAEITLTPLSAATDVLLANSLPNKDALASFLDSTANCLESTSKTCAVASSILRAYFVLTEHEYGFQQFRKFVTKRRESLGNYFKWALEGPGEDKAECLSLYIDLIRILKVEEGEGPVGRKSALTVNELADMVGYSPSEENHPAMNLEKILRDRNADDDALANASFLTTHLQKFKVTEEPGTPPTDPAESVLPPPDTLVAQFAARIIYSIGEANDERLTSSYWLNVPSASGDDDVNDNELVSCDIVEIASAYLSGGVGGAGGAAGGAEALAGAVRRLAGCGARPPPPPRDQRPPGAVAMSRVRGEGGADAFRSRPPNTSRPPSLHVDDFTALHHAPHHAHHHHAHHQPYAAPAAALLTRGPRRGGGAVGASGAGGVGGAAGAGAAERGRFVAPAPHYRHLRGRGAWEMGGQHFGHFAPTSQYMMGGMGWGGARMQRGPRHRSFMR